MMVCMREEGEALKGNFYMTLTKIAGHIFLSRRLKNQILPSCLKYCKKYAFKNFETDQNIEYNIVSHEFNVLN